jgi:hypothetical protein
MIITMSVLKIKGKAANVIPVRTDDLEWSIGKCNFPRFQNH